MFGLDDAIAGLGGSGTDAVVALAIALLLGLRHATDPDHLTAVSTLVMSEQARGARRAAGLGAAWGLGHGLTLFAVGLPVVLFGDHLPSWLQESLEVAVGAVIVLLAVRLLLRWRRGHFHAHVHSHGEGLGRSPLAAFGLGLLHGAGGSAGVSVLLVAAVPAPGAAVAALAVLAVGTVASMTAVSAGFGLSLARESLLGRFEPFAPVFGTLSLAFGLWYGLAAVHAVPYVF